MKIFNTLSRRKEEFVPLEPGKVKMYVCGPTVYNLIHIGNARPMIVFDTVRRYFEYKGYEVNFVSNFTDVDDKIIKKANEEGVEAGIISERYIAECKKDMQGMNVKPATTHPQATNEIDGMIAMINSLIEKGHAYAAADGTVYFRTRSFRGYGKLSHKNLDDLQSGMRALLVSGEEQKEDPLDFVLWKPKKENEPYWVSPWCDGRPGWHIECSVMSKRYLGDEIDIHAGGEDLIFPHHENEIAQSEAANGKTFARYWMHNAFLNIDNKKMSKSAGNFFTVRDISEKYDLQVLRYFMLSAQYRTPLNFSAELMEAAKNGLERIVTCAHNLTYLSEHAAGASDASAPAGGTADPMTAAGSVAAGGTADAVNATAGGTADPMTAAGSAAAGGTAAGTSVAGCVFCHAAPMSAEEQECLTEANQYVTRFEEAMDDDFNTADAISVVFELVKYINSHVSGESSKGYLQALYGILYKLTDVLGLIVEKKEEILDEEIERLIAERQAARKEKNFARADEIRKELLEKGIVLEDTREGVKWKRA